MLPIASVRLRGDLLPVGLPSAPMTSSSAIQLASLVSLIFLAILSMASSQEISFHLDESLRPVHGLGDPLRVDLAVDVGLLDSRSALAAERAEVDGAVGVALDVYDLEVAALLSSLDTSVPQPTAQ